MKSFHSLLAFVFISATTSMAYSQMSLEGISSGRYEVRKSKSRAPASVTDDGVEVKVTKPSETPVKPMVTEKPKVEALPTSGPAAPAPAVTETEVPQEPSLGEQAESLMSSKMDRIYEFYREQVHPDDIRNNRIELDILPIIAYNDSQSNYSYRQYQSYFNGLQFKANVWFTPLIGVSGKFMFSLAADVDSMAADKSRVPVKYEFMDLGINLRRFFGTSRKDPSLEFNFLFSENKMNPPGDNTTRARLKSQGFGLGLKARLPSNAQYAWVVGGSFFPRLQQVEMETGANIQSGSAGESIRIGLDLGGEWKFTRESQLIWNLGLSAEKNMYGGVANLVDPGTGVTPSNVSVTNSLCTFSLGYRWGH